MSAANENRETCKRIAAEIEAYHDRTMYRCPECRKAIEWQNEQYDSEENVYTCPECRKTFDESELEALSVYDYLSRSYYDLEYRVDAQGNYKSVEIMVAGGGPSIYIDTGCNAVKLFWWGEKAEYSISPEAASAIDEYFEEEFRYMR